MDLDTLTGWEFPVVRQHYGASDTILYALGVGAGTDPMDKRQLPFVYERELRILPSQSSVLAFPGRWLTTPELKVDYLKVLHGEQGVIFERPLKPSAHVRGEFSVIGVDDKGPERGAVLYLEKRLIDEDDGALICRVQSSYFLRGDGGCGGWGRVPPAAAPIPDGKPDWTITVPTMPQQALIYRLSGDDNPIHADPDIAAAAGFNRPILHGLSTYGAMCLGIVTELCEGNGAAIAELFARFSKPVYPGETIQLELFSDGPERWQVRARAAERDTVVLDRGHVRLR